MTLTDKVLVNLENAQIGNILPWSSFRNSFRKFKIQVLFIKSDIVPFKIFPIDCNALMPAFDLPLETFLELYCWYSHQSRLWFFHYLSAVKTRSQMVFWLDQKKSQRATSGEFDGCWIFISFLIKNSLIANSTPFLKTKKSYNNLFHKWL